MRNHAFPSNCGYGTTSPLFKAQTPGGTGGVNCASEIPMLLVGLAGFYASSLEDLGKRAETCEG